MPFNDAELNKLAQTRDIYRRIRDEKKQWLDRAYSSYDLTKRSLGSQIDSLSAQHDRLYENMSAAFERANNAFSYKDHEGAKSWSAEGRRIKAEMQGVTAQRRRLIDEMRAARANFHEARDAYRRAKAEHELHRDAFQSRLEWLKQEAARQRAERERNGNRRRNVGPVAGAIITGAIGVYGTLSNPPQSGASPLRDEARVLVNEERNRRARIQRGATRDRGWESGNSGQKQ